MEDHFMDWSPPSVAVQPAMTSHDAQSSHGRNEEAGSCINEVKNLVSMVQSYLRVMREGHEMDPGLVSAWDCFYRRYNPLVSQTVFDFARDQYDSADCLQTAWMHIIIKMDKFELRCNGDIQFRRWLRIVVRRALLDRARVRRPPKPLSRLIAEGLASRDGDPAIQHERDDDRFAIRRVLIEIRTKIPADSYRILHLRWFEDRCLDEIAILLGLTSAQVRFRHHRALRRLRELLQSHSDYQKLLLR